MKRFLSKQLLNIVFLVLIVAGALTIYFLSRAERKADASPASQKTSAGASSETSTEAFTEASSEASAERSAASAAPTPDETPSSGDSVLTTEPVATAAAAKRPRGVPEAVFATHLATSDLFDAAVSADDPHLYTLSYGDSPAVTATLQYTVDGGAISSLELTFQLPPEYDEKSESAIEQYLASSQNEMDEARAEAIRALLTDLLPASDLNDALSKAGVRLWAEESLRISSENDDYNQKSEGCSFLAYRMSRDGRDVLVCLFFLEG